MRTCGEVGSGKQITLKNLTLALVGPYQALVQIDVECCGNGMSELKGTS